MVAAAMSNERPKRPKVLARKRAASERPTTVSKRPAGIAPLVPEPSVHGQLVPSNVLPLFPDFVPDYEWVLGLVPMPGPNAWAALFLEAGSGLVVHVDLLAHATPEAVGATLRRALGRGEVLGLRRPTRIRIGVPDQAELLVAAEPLGLGLVVGPVPEVEEVLRAQGAVKVVAQPATDDIDVYRGSAQVTDAQLAAFFKAAEELRRGRSSRVLQGDRPLVLRCAALGLDEAGAIVEIEPHGGLRIVWGGTSLAIRFDRSDQLSPARSRELASLAFAPPRGPHPVLAPVGEDGRLRRAEGADYELATATLFAIGRFASEYGELVRHTSLRALVAHYAVRLGRSHVVEVELGWPEERS
jgi:hypothetical protein